MDYEYELEAKDIMSKIKDDDVHTRSLLLIADVLWEIQCHLESLTEGVGWKAKES